MRSHYDEDKSYLVSGKTFNEIREGLGGTLSYGDSTVNRGGDSVYVSGTTASAYTAVGMGSLESTDEDGGILYGGLVFTAVQAEQGKPFAVLLEDGVTDFVTKACQSGICRALVNVTASTHTHADISGGTLTSSDGGAARILWKPSGTGVRQCLIDIQPVGGGVSVGDTLTGAIHAVGTTLEASTTTTTYSKTVTMPVGRDSRGLGDTSAHRPTVAQGEAEIRTEAPAFVPFGGTTAGMSVIEAETPPRTGTGLFYCDAVKYGLNVPVLRYSPGHGIPNIEVGATEVTVKWGVPDDWSILTTNGNGEVRSITPSDYTLDAIPAWMNGAYGFIQPYDGAGVMVCQDGGFSTVGLDGVSVDQILVWKHGTGNFSQFGNGANPGKASIPYWNDNGELTDASVGSTSVETVVIVDKSGNLTAPIGGSSSGRYRLVMISGQIRWETY